MIDGPPLISFAVLGKNAVEMSRLKDFFWGRYVRAMRGTIHHPVLGRLTLTHCIPSVNMYWWQSQVAFPPTDGTIWLELHSPSTGPTPAQAAAFQSLSSQYDEILRAARIQRLVPHDAKLTLESVVIFIHAHVDLMFHDQDGELVVYLDDHLQLLSPMEAEMC